MILLKCKMCGGDLEIVPESTVCECAYCGTKQTVPTVDNEKKISLFARANKLRAACDFDKAAGVYESIVTEFPEEAEAYWGLILCNFGIEYVDDPATGKKIPTCHRSSFESVLNSSDFEMVMENADVIARKVYREEAKAIEELRKAILEVASKEEPYDIFICYKETDENGDRTIDSVIAQDVYTELTAKGYRVFFSRITLEDKLGQEYEPYIFAALNSAMVMLAFGTDYEYYNAVWVKNEWSRFLHLIERGEKKTLIPCYKNIDAYDMPKEFAKLQAQDMGKVGAIQDLVRGIDKIMGRSEAQPTAKTEPVVVQAGGPNVQALLKRGFMALEDGSFADAKTHFDKVLDMNAECAEAYLGLAMAEERVGSKRDFIFKNKLDNKNYKRAKQFASESLLSELITLEKAAEEERIRQEKAAEEERIRKEKAAEEERIRQAQEAEERAQLIEADKFLLAAIRKKLTGANGLIMARVHHTVCQRSDGTVVAVGYNDDGRCNVAGWSDIVAISAGLNHTVGLKADGTVVAVGAKGFDRCNVAGWSDIVAISAGICHTVGLKADGTVVAVGDNDHGQCDVNGWTDMVAISAGSCHTVGLKADGTVVAVGAKGADQCNVTGWTDIVAISAGARHTVGLKADGTVVAVGNNGDGQCNVAGWTDIVAISAGYKYTVGLKKDGTVVAVGDNEDGRCDVDGWTDIVAISAGSNHTVGLKKDGTVVAVGHNDWGQCNVTDWKLFDDFNNLEEERRQKTEKKTAELKRISAQQAEYRSQGLCQHCGGSFKGLLFKKCSACGKEKDY